MNLIDNISDRIKVAMKARDQLTLDALRSIKKELLEARTAKGSGGVVSADDEMKILVKMVKQRRDSATIYAEQGRADMSAQESAEAEVISQFLPAQLSTEQLESKVKEIIAQTGAASIKEMGKVMGQATKQLAGKADGKDISAAVKRLLS
jgi:uncharacterized protein YqeY